MRLTIVTLCLLGLIWLVYITLKKRIEVIAGVVDNLNTDIDNLDSRTPTKTEKGK